MSEDQMLRDMLRSFRAREVEPIWEKLDTPEPTLLALLWDTLGELGVDQCGLSEAHGGVALPAAARIALMQELGASCPAVGAALLGHFVAQRLVSAALGHGPMPVSLGAARLALVGSPLDTAPSGGVTVRQDGAGALCLRGEVRVMWPQPDVLCIGALHGDAPALCVVPVESPGVSLQACPSSHGLCLLQFGTLRLRDVAVTEAQCLPWPKDAAGQAAREADGMLAALLAGLLRELCERATDYALQRVQGGKPIHQHDAVRQLLGGIEMSRRVAHAMATATMEDTCSAGDGVASAVAVQRAREAGLDAIQVFGGYGYMEDYRVERYLRDAGTLETMWIHADARRRAAAAAVARRRGN